MKILFTLFVLLFSSSAYANNYTSLKTWMLDKDRDDPAVMIYYVQRCNAYFLSLGKMLKTKSPDLAEKNILIAGDILKLGIAYFAETQNISLETSRSNYSKLLIESSNLYIEDMNSNWLKTGSLFEGSYLQEDNSFCNTFYSTVFKK